MREKHLMNRIMCKHLFQREQREKENNVRKRHDGADGHFFLMSENDSSIKKSMEAEDKIHV